MAIDSVRRMGTVASEAERQQDRVAKTSGGDDVIRVISAWADMHMRRPAAGMRLAACTSSGVHSARGCLRKLVLRPRATPVAESDCTGVPVCVAVSRMLNQLVPGILQSVRGEPFEELSLYARNPLGGRDRIKRNNLTPWMVQGTRVRSEARYFPSQLTTGNTVGSLR